jgi:RNA polymerase sigma-70 factor (ECF subfamily)
MASSPAPDPCDAPASAAVREFAAQQYEGSGASRFRMDETDLVAVLADVVKQRPAGRDETGEQEFLASLRLEELVLARACANGNDYAWEVFLTRYRNTLYETAYKIAKVESVARGLADSLYAELYGVDSKGQQRNSKLRSYQGRGPLQGWLRMVIAQAYVDRYRSTRRETSLEAALEDGTQFAARESEVAVADPRVDVAVSAELAALDAGERFLMAAYYLDHRTLAEIAKLQGVHESTISRKLERAVKGVCKRIVKRLVQEGMDFRQAQEAMENTDVRDLRVRVRETLRQEMPETAFYKEKGEPQG